MQKKRFVKRLARLSNSSTKKANTQNDNEESKEYEDVPPYDQMAMANAREPSQLKKPPPKSHGGTAKKQKENEESKEYGGVPPLDQMAAMAYARKQSKLKKPPSATTEIQPDAKRHKQTPPFAAYKKSDSDNSSDEE